MMLRQKINKIKRRSYKLYNKLFIYLPVDILIYFRNLLRGVRGVFRSERSTPAENQEKRVIIFRHDGIGDYVLFRNFLEVLKKSPRFAGYKITLLGNAAWKDLAEFLDKDYIDKFIWLDKKSFTVDFFYRYKKFKEITAVKYDILIHPFSREFFNADNDLAFLIKADKKIGSIRLPRFTKPYKNKILEKIYNELIPDVENIRFEFYKNKNFFEKLLSETAAEKISAEISLNRPFINLPARQAATTVSAAPAPVSAADSAPTPALSGIADLKSKLGISSPYAAFFIGASVKHRKWSPEYFAETARYLHTKYGFHIVLCGGKSELNDAAEFKKHFPSDLADNASFTDAVGKISLIELFYIVKDASLVISNETMAPHIAMALANAGTVNDASRTNQTASATSAPDSPNIPSGSPSLTSAPAPKPAVIVISTGEDSFEHFSPYPKEITGNSNYAIVFHPHIEQNPKEYIDIAAALGRGYDDRFDISEITVRAVLNKIDKIL
ncbi:MAG: lipopolysaccharide heptosyltransferase family protein [Candidatus Acidulodesulfobacterium acidiphilum]|uniref:Lipopolysaccharide heptosyltransferase family protein n=1 Tax=Candidatus Acidulodesulfobacterium acidiphilum TaxID=2597224 RepID=A0A520XBZ2_9DELT|nr:MAG: lipopolysaccharide heptosyltransferase family protein [Candidatus Acidulodesulfobacterium acidiphilum]